MTRSVIVTGAAHGIGLALARAAIADGWYVVAVDNDGSRLEREFAGEDRATTVTGSVHEAEVGQVIKKLEELGREFEALINNVGVTAERSWNNLTHSDLMNTLGTNVVGPWMLSKWWAERAVQAGHSGTIIFVTSLHTRQIRLFPDYSMSKAAILQLIREAAVALAPHRIRVNGLQPGAIDTWSEGNGATDRDEESNKIIPLGRLGRTRDLEGAALFLLDEERSGYVTGTQIKVDGGLDMHNWLLDLPAEDPG